VRPSGAALGLDDTDFLEATVVPLRVREGDDASCLNLGSAQLPRLLGVDPQALVSRGAFTKESSRIWALLAAPAPAGEVPAVADHATLKWALGKSVGDRIAYTDEAGRRFDVRIVAMIGDSLFQGSLVIDRRHFERRYPGIAGYRTLLIDAPTNVAAPLGRTLSRALADHGLEVTPTVQKLRRFLAVQNTYLSIFQALGGLGLLLGSGGLGMVVLRNVMERRGELALLRAVGYSMGQLRWMLFSEHTLLLALGLATGVITAIVAIIPALRSPGVRIPYGLIATTLAAVTLLGGLWVWLAAVAAVRGKLVEALQSE
jgi:putative ABC transport system permease protein